VSDADDPSAKLAELVSQAERHRKAARDYRVFGSEVDLGGYWKMAENHDAMFVIVCDQIRSHCREHGLQLPDWASEEERG
jgi:hypothetical protein